MYYLKFYADCPDGQHDKLFTYSVHQGGHAFDLLRRFFARGFQVRAAFIQPQDEARISEQLAASVLVQLASGGPVEEAKARAGLLARYPLKVEK